MNKKLYKNKRRGMVSGVLAGLSEYMNIDVTIIRIIVIVVTMFSYFLPCVIAYFVCAAIMPDKDSIGYDDYKVD